MAKALTEAVVTPGAHRPSGLCAYLAMLPGHHMFHSELGDQHHGVVGAQIGAQLLVRLVDHRSDPRAKQRSSVLEPRALSVSHTGSGPSGLELVHLVGERVDALHVPVAPIDHRVAMRIINGSEASHSRIHSAYRSIRRGLVLAPRFQRHVEDVVVSVPVPLPLPDQSPVVKQAARQRAFRALHERREDVGKECAPGDVPVLLEHHDGLAAVLFASKAEIKGHGVFPALLAEHVFRAAGLVGLHEVHHRTVPDLVRDLGRPQPAMKSQAVLIDERGTLRFSSKLLYFCPFRVNNKRKY